MKLEHIASAILFVSFAACSPATPEMSPQPDGAVVSPDASVEVDGDVMMEADAGAVLGDAGEASPDLGEVAMDAAVSLPDMSGPSLDSGVSFDAGVDEPDAGELPALLEQAYIKASNTDAGDKFGLRIALSADGNTLAVGAPYEDSRTRTINGDGTNDDFEGAGAVYVFVRSGTVWSQEAYIKAADASRYDAFGASVALSADGSRLVVGAPFEDGGGTGVNSTSTDVLTDSGAAYVFVRSGTTWSQEAYVKASNTDRDDRFGESVDISADGGRFVVGAYREDGFGRGVNRNGLDNTVPDSGAAYVFVRSGTTWSQEAYMKPSNTGEGDWFGLRCAISGDGLTVAVSASEEDSGATGIDGDDDNDDVATSGAVFVFRRPFDVWAQEAYVKPEEVGVEDVFGISLSLSGDGSRLVVGAYQEDSGTRGVNGNAADDSVTDSGAAYVFARGGGVWAQEAYLKASSPRPSDRFGMDVAISADGLSVVVGAIWQKSWSAGVFPDDPGSYVAERAGAAYLFTRAGSDWTQRAFIKPLVPAAYDSFAGQVAVSSDGLTIAVGAEDEQSAATGVGGDPTDDRFFQAGAAYVFFGAP